mmetsp:Transcript_13400/g.15086  ORF Transcript_13400/g.15086 Transcript_13400/m.15086 type:complete len:518 (-) Transcript_13400:686-2239(-)
MGKKRTKNDKKLNSNAATSMKKKKKHTKNSSIANISSQNFGSDTTSKQDTITVVVNDNNMNGNENVSASSSIFSSLFGNEYENNFSKGVNIGKSNSNSDDLFSTSKKNQLQQLSKARVEQNRTTLQIDSKEKSISNHDMSTEPFCKSTSSSSSSSSSSSIDNKIILQSRQNQSISQESIDAIKSISVPIPHIHNENYDDDDDDEIKRGMMRLFVQHSEVTMRENGVLIVTSYDGDKDKDSYKANERSSSNQQTKPLFDLKLLDNLSKDAKMIEHVVCSKLKGKGILWNVKRENNVDGKHDNLKLEKDNAFRYYEVASRCLGRLDIRYGMDRPPFTNDSIICNSFLMPLIHSLLGEGAKLLYSGLILSFPNSADQPWHQDGSALFSEDEEFLSNVHLPPYALNVFIPLDDITHELGPTEFYVGSHIHNVGVSIMESLSQDRNKNLERNLNGTNKEDSAARGAIGPLLKRGDVLIYDYRICHRGTSNLSTDKTRPMLYLMYARPWFYEHLNFGTDRLFN